MGKTAKAWLMCTGLAALLYTGFYLTSKNQAEHKLAQTKPEWAYQESKIILEGYKTLPFPTKFIPQIMGERTAAKNYIKQYERSNSAPSEK